MPSKRLPMHKMGVLTLFPKILGFLRTFEKVLRRVKGRALAHPSLCPINQNLNKLQNTDGNPIGKSTHKVYGSLTYGT